MADPETNAVRAALEEAAIDLECIATAIRHGFEAQAAVDADMSAARARAALSPEGDDGIVATRGNVPGPDGWQFVPEDATDDMIAAALAVDWANEDEVGTVHNVWHRMLAAAQPPLPVQTPSNPEDQDKAAATPTIADPVKEGGR